MYQDILSDHVHLYISENNTWNWKQHSEDIDQHPPFITYIGGNNYQKLDKIIADIPYPVRAIRRDAKHFKQFFSYELKIWGLSWAHSHLIAEAIANKQQPVFEEVA